MVYIEFSEKDHDRWMNIHFSVYETDPESKVEKAIDDFEKSKKRIRESIERGQEYRENTPIKYL